MQILTRSHDNTNTHGNGWMGLICSECICPTNVLYLKEGRKEGEPEGERERRKEGRKEGRRTRKKAREKEQLLREREKSLDSIRPETNSVLS